METLNDKKQSSTSNDDPGPAPESYFTDFDPNTGHCGAEQGSRFSITLNSEHTNFPKSSEALKAYLFKTLRCEGCPLINECYINIPTGATIKNNTILHRQPVNSVNPIPSFEGFVPEETTKDLVEKKSSVTDIQLKNTLIGFSSNWLTQLKAFASSVTFIG